MGVMIAITLSTLIRLGYAEACIRNSAALLRRARVRAGDRAKAKVRAELGLGLPFQ